ncbi:MAG: hypothetical protein KBE65_23560 [Phycisphaerae bacterium]|nr:hypothetical protein [Phycisphaerae bacterium]
MATIEDSRIAVLGMTFALSMGMYPASGEEPVCFADATLKAAVEETLWIVDPTPADMLGLTSLSCSGWGGQSGVICDLAGLEYAVNLRCLSLQFQGFCSLSPLSYMVRLERLDLRACPVCDISSLAGMHRLEWLNLHKTQIRDISPILGLPSLGYIDLREVPLNLDAYAIHIPQLRAARPGITILYDPYRAPEYSGGSGSAADPYQIATAVDLIVLGETPADYGKHFVLTADIDLDPNLASRKVFDRAVIAADTNPATFLYEGIAFTGVLDGGGHTIRNLTITGGQYLGLFGWISPGGEVRDLGLKAVQIHGTGSYVGALVGRTCRSSISACYSTGSVGGESDVDGLVGCNEYGSVCRSHSSSSICGSGWGVGGLVGLNFGHVSTSSSSGPVGGTGSGAGGLVGDNDEGGSISISYACGPVSGNYYLGGLAGDNEGDIIASYSSSSVRGTYDYVGGLVGENQGSISVSYSSGPVDGVFKVGGLVGTAGFGSVVSRSFWNIETSGQPASDGGTGLSNAEMLQRRVFLEAGWDWVDEIGNGLSEIWKIPEEGGYPVLTLFHGHTLPRLSGRGTPDDPYLISDAHELGAIVHYNPAAHYRMSASVDLAGIRWSTAVVPQFEGVFDGNGFTISHLHVEGCAYLGLFGQLTAKARIMDLGVVEATIIGSGDCIGGLAGSSGSTMSGCHSTGFVVGHDRAGGLIGMGRGTVSDSHSTATVTGATSVGGLVGENDGHVSRSASLGTVIGSQQTIGGLIGSNEWNGVVDNCYATADVTGGTMVGGLAGINWGKITACYSTGAVAGSPTIGGLVGHNRREVTGCFWDLVRSRQDQQTDGVGKTTAEMQTTSTFLDAGWDFMGESANGTEDLWWILEGKDYPRLWWELPPQK